MNPAQKQEPAFPKSQESWLFCILIAVIGLHNIMQKSCGISFIDNHDDAMYYKKQP